MSGELIVVLILARYFLKIIPNSSPLKKWEKEFKWGMAGIALLIVIDIFTPAFSIFDWLGHLILLSVISVPFLYKEFRFLRNISVAVFPFAVAALLKQFLLLGHSPFWDKMTGYIKIIYPIAIVWLIAMLVIGDKQRKALQKERQRREAEEEQNKIIAARKTELEAMVSERTSALLKQKEELEHALSELRETQAQLIQKEKMASLGELTAGIAHEIQNPLNFVNNFSEINKELLAELETEINSGNFDEVKAIALDLKENELKIHEHGRRADAIVKGMLQHSRASSGTKEATDINALADEYLRLSYHGLRAKEKSFNAAFKTDFDESIGKLDLVPQEIGRVLLNLFNNAFYAVAEKKKQNPEGYNPLVSVTTKAVTLATGVPVVRVCVKDNGSGIPKHVLDKIYQPFFTTKPAGQGTGLGLSLSYEIVKAHGGELRLETKEGEFAEFIIDLPVLPADKR